MAKVRIIYETSKLVSIFFCFYNRRTLTFVISLVTKYPDNGVKFDENN